MSDGLTGPRQAVMPRCGSHARPASKSSRATATSSTHSKNPKKPRFSSYFRLWTSLTKTATAGDLATSLGKQRHHFRSGRRRGDAPSPAAALLRKDRRHPVRIARVDRPRQPLKAPPIPPRYHCPDRNPSLTGRPVAWAVMQPLILDHAPAHVRDVRRRGAVLHRHQPAHLVRSEVGIGLLAERQADEGGRRKPRDQHVAVGDHLLGAAVVNTRAPGACRFTSLSARAVLVGVELEDQRAAAAIATAPDERLAVLAAEDLPQRRRADQHVMRCGKVLSR